MTVVLRDQWEQPVAIRGFAALFGAKSVPLAERAGRRELIQQRAFASVDFGAVKARVDGHTNSDELVGVDLVVVASDLGLEFELSDIEANERNIKLVHAVGMGWKNGCSFGFRYDDAEVKDHNGENVVVVSSVRGLTDIAFTNTPAYPATGCWLAHHKRLPAHLAALRDAWTLTPAQAPSAAVRSPGPIASSRRRSPASLLAAYQSALATMAVGRSR